jgi:hypothetical protein
VPCTGHLLAARPRATQPNGESALSSQSTRQASARRLHTLPHGHTLLTVPLVNLRLMPGAPDRWSALLICLFDLFMYVFTTSRCKGTTLMGSARYPTGFWPPTPFALTSLVVSALLSTHQEATFADILPASLTGRDMRMRSGRMSQCPSRLCDISAVQARYSHLPTLVLPVGVRPRLCLLRGSIYEVLRFRSGHLLEDADALLSGGLDHYEAVLCRHCGQDLCGLVDPDPALLYLSCAGSTLPVRVPGATGPALLARQHQVYSKCSPPRCSHRVSETSVAP